MAMHLRQSTASQSVLIGPFVDSTDGNTAETGLTIDAADIRLSKNGANIAGKNSGGGSHDELGYYTITLDATDTDTVGRLQLMVHEAGALPVYHEFEVIEEAAYDALYAANANPKADVNVASIDADAITATAIADGTITAAKLGADCITAAKIANGAIDAATFAADVDAEILSYLVDDATRIDASALNTASVTTVPAIVADTNELQTDWVNGGRLDLLIDAIKAKTDNLPSDPADASVISGRFDTVDTALAGTLDANITSVNGVSVGGAGTSGNPWGPA